MAALRKCLQRLNQVGIAGVTLQRAELSDSTSCQPEQILFKKIRPVRLCRNSASKGRETGSEELSGRRLRRKRTLLDQGERKSPSQCGTHFPLFTSSCITFCLEFKDDPIFSRYAVLDRKRKPHKTLDLKNITYSEGKSACNFLRLAHAVLMVFT